MTPGLVLSDEITEAIDRISAADRAWFAAHPHRRFYLRPASIHEFPPGFAVAPGDMRVVINLAYGRMRVSVGKPPFRLRRNTDAACRELLERKSYRLPDGRSLNEALAELIKTNAERSSADHDKD